MLRNEIFQCNIFNLYKGEIMRKVLLLILLLFGCMDTMSFANEPYDIFVVNDSLYTE